MQAMSRLHLGVIIECYLHIPETMMPTASGSIATTSTPVPATSGALPTPTPRGLLSAWWLWLGLQPLSEGTLPGRHVGVLDGRYMYPVSSGFWRARR